MLEAIVLGIIQGITEFLPVSSTAHLVLVPWFLGWTGLVDSLAFDVALHAGTLLAILICFWRDIVDILTRRMYLAVLIIFATIPAGVVGITLQHKIEHEFRTPLVIAAGLIIFAVVMFIADRGFKRRNMNDIGFGNALFIGCCQAIAVIPGVSRSGSTITGGLLTGLRRDEAARFSFLLSIPVIAGAALLEGRKIFKSPEQYDMSLLAAGFVASAITGVLAIKFLMGFLKRHSMNLFVAYRFALGALILVWWKWFAV